MTRFPFVLVFVTAATTTFGGAPTAQAADVVCAGTLGGGSAVTSITGDVTVPEKASCTLDFVTIGGNVEAVDCSSVLLQGNVTVEGNLHIQSCSGGPNGFQGPDTLVKGDFHCQSNAGPCLAWLGKVEGNLHIQSNRSKAASDVSLVSVGGNLHCQQNSPAPTQARGPSWVDGNSQGQCFDFSTTTTSIGTPVTPAAFCAALAALPAAGFPVPNTVITSAVDAPATATLPARCIVNGYVNAHVSPVDTCTYQSRFQVQLPLPANWNGRFMMQGGGGGEGSVPTATGTIGGSTGI